MEEYLMVVLFVPISIRTVGVIVLVLKCVKLNAQRARMIFA
jgi:hypothetical protein